MGASVFMCEKAFSQVPSYVPTNGLVGWWPFNGNANDESGNGNNGTVNGATLTTDRFGNANKAYSFDGSDFVNVTNSSIAAFGNSSFTALVWFKTNIAASAGDLIRYDNCLTGSGWGILLDGQGGGAGQGLIQGLEFSQTRIPNSVNSLQTLNNGIWHVATLVRDVNLMKDMLYIDGSLNSQIIFNSINLIQNTGNPLHFGSCGSYEFFNGILDDIGIWNRALTQQEITDIFNANSCSNDLTISPTTNTQNIGGNSTFTAVTSDANPTYYWQTDFGQGYQTLSNYGDYSGTNTNALTISNVQLANHNQPIRAISTSGNCIDTSNIATVQIADTCITNVTVYDTLLTTVTDTLIINTTLSLPAPNNENTILIYPNPASDHITIDNGNYTAMAGYTIKIENNAGQQVFQSLINQAQFYVDLSTWSGNGLYFVHLIDAQGNTVTVRKIVLQ